MGLLNPGGPIAQSQRNRCSIPPVEVISPSGVRTWKDFADDTARREFVDYFCIANPHLIKDSREHLFWQDYFNAYFHCNCTFPFIARLINSFMVTGEQAQ